VSEKKAPAWPTCPFAPHHAGLLSDLEQKDTTEFNLGMHHHVPSLLWSKEQLVVSSTLRRFSRVYVGVARGALLVHTQMQQKRHEKEKKRGPKKFEKLKYCQPARRRPRHPPLRWPDNSARPNSTRSTASVPNILSQSRGSGQGTVPINFVPTTKPYRVIPVVRRDAIRVRRRTTCSILYQIVTFQLTC
jgi:hypothetical protein